MISFLSLKSLASRKFITFLCILSISLSLSLFLIVEKLKDGVQDGFTNTISQADLIVGARSGPTQLLLYTVFHMGSPTNNILYSSYEKIKNHPTVAWTIPISLGDSYQGFRVVGTDKNFLEHYRFYGDKKVELQHGKWKNSVFGVVLGSMVAYKLNHSVGDEIILSHGIQEDSVMDHDNAPFEVSGILKPTGTPIDKSVFISLYGMEAIHVGWENGVPHYGEEEDLSEITKEQLKTEQLTSFILRTKNRIALLGLQRYIMDFKPEALSAIIPAMTLTELWGMLDQLENAFVGISFFVILIGFLSILIALYMSLNERSQEMAILRSVGVSARQIVGLLLSEAFFLSLTGGIFGFVLQYLILGAMGPFIEERFGLSIPISNPTSFELIVVGGFITLGTLSGLIPALKAYRSSLYNGLSS